MNSAFAGHAGVGGHRDREPADIVGLAGALGLAYRETGLTLADGVDAPMAMAAGIAALSPACAPLRFAIAPTALSAELLARNGAINRPDIALMPEADYRAMLRRDGAASLAAHAAGALERRCPGQCARQGLSAAQRGLVALALGVGALAFLLEPTALGVLVAIATMPFFYLLVWLRCGAVAEMIGADGRSGRAPEPAELPVYTVLVPLYGEAKVVPQLVAALRALDYPADRLDIKIIVEADDDSTRAALAAELLPAHVECVVAPPGQPRTKPRALNIGLLEARGEFLTIYDAEDRPEPDQLRRAAADFRRLPERVACLQARLVIDNVDDGWLTRMFALEYAGLFDVVNAGLMRAGLPVLLGGTSNHFRTSVLRRIGGWDAWNVTEDADLAFRLLRHGYSMADLPSSTFEEAPAGFGPWFRQRVRWMKGFMQTTITHTRDPRWIWRGPERLSALTLLTLCFGTVMSALAYPLFVAGVIALILSGPDVAMTLADAAWAGIWGCLIAAGFVAMILPPLVGAWRRGLGDIAHLTVLMPLYCLLISAATLAALVEHAVAPTRWNKTPHGLAQTSRLKQARPSAKMMH